MGQEIACTASSDGRRAGGRAQLETDELLFRGDGLRLRIPYASMTAVRAADGVLEVDHEGATSTFELGDRAVVEPMGGLSLKGKAEPVEAYRLLALRS